MENSDNLWPAIKVLLLLLLLIATARFFIYSLGLEGQLFTTVHDLATLVLVLTIYLHMFFVLGKTAAFFIILAFSSGLVAELSGVLYGVPFGKYHYTDVLTATWPSILGLVPLCVPLMWSALIYASYSATNLLVRRRGAPPYLLSCIDAAYLVAFDLLLDPIAVKVGLWVWHEEGPYFGVPLSNFAGWFLVTYLTTLVYRLIAGGEEEYPRGQRGAVPGLALTCFILILFMDSISLGEPILALVSVLVGALFMAAVFIEVREFQEV